MVVTATGNGVLKIARDLLYKSRGLDKMEKV